MQLFVWLELHKPNSDTRCVGAASGKYLRFRMPQQSIAKLSGRVEHRERVSCQMLACTRIISARSRARSSATYRTRRALCTRANRHVHVWTRCSRSAQRPCRGSPSLAHRARRSYDEECVRRRAPAAAAPILRLRTNFFGPSRILQLSQ